MIFFPTVNFLILPCVAYAQFDWQGNTPLPLPALSPIAAAPTIVDNDHQKKRPCSQETAFANILPISLDNSTPIFLSQETDPLKILFYGKIVFIFHDFLLDYLKAMPKRGNQKKREGTHEP